MGSDRESAGLTPLSWHWPLRARETPYGHVRWQVGVRSGDKLVADAPLGDEDRWARGVIPKLAAKVRDVDLSGSQ